MSTPSSASIEGQVIGFYSGKPVEDVIVRASGQPAGSQPSMIMISAEGTLQSKSHLASTRTDSNGNYQFADLPVGEYTVWAESPLGDIGNGGGICRGVEGLKVGGGSSPTVTPTLTIGPVAKIFGRLVDGDTGKPLSLAVRGATLQATGVFVDSSWLQEMTGRKCRFLLTDRSRSGPTRANRELISPRMKKNPSLAAAS